MENEAARVTAIAPRRRGPASTENGQRSRDRVLNAALDLITEAGIDQVRVAEIARRAGMSSGQVMYYFPSKEHILLETLAWRDQQDIQRTRAALGKVTGAWHQLERFIGLYLPASPADPGWILWMEVWARAPHNRQVSQRLEELLRLWRDELAAIVARGVQEGTFTPPAAIDDFTLRFAALLDGLAILRLRQMHQPTRKRLIDLAMSSARAELARDAAAAPADLARAAGRRSPGSRFMRAALGRGPAYLRQRPGRVGRARPHAVASWDGSRNQRPPLSNE